MKTRLFVLVALALTFTLIATAQPRQRSAGATVPHTNFPIVGIIADLIDPAKLATLRERDANPRVQKYVFWLVTAQANGQSTRALASAAVLAAGYTNSLARTLTADAMLRNLDIATKLGCLDAAGTNDMRHGRPVTTASARATRATPRPVRKRSRNYSAANRASSCWTNFPFISAKRTTSTARPRANNSAHSSRRCSRPSRATRACRSFIRSPSGLHPRSLSCPHANRGGGTMAFPPDNYGPKTYSQSPPASIRAFPLTPDAPFSTLRFAVRLP